LYQDHLELEVVVEQELLEQLEHQLKEDQEELVQIYHHYLQHLYLIQEFILVEEVEV
jgi:hypothetical protein